MAPFTDRALLVAAATLLVAASAGAQPSGSEAQRRRLLQAASDARDAGQHEHALGLLQQAAALRDNASIHWYLATEHFTLGHYADAAREARFCMGLATHDPSSTATRGECASIALLAEDRLRGTSNNPARGPSVREPSALKPSPVPDTARAPHRAGAPWAGPLLLAGLGTAGIVTGLVFVGRRNDVLAGCQLQGSVGVCHTQDDIDRAQPAATWATSANVALWLGGAALAAGVSWWVVARVLGRPSERRATAWVAPHAGGAALGLAGSF